MSDSIDFLTEARGARLAETDDDTWTVKEVTAEEVVIHKGDAEWCPIYVRLQASTAKRLNPNRWEVCDESNTEYRVSFESRG